MIRVNATEPFRGKYEGHEQIRDFFQFVRDLYPDLEFSNLNVVCEQADQNILVAEYEFNARSTKTGRVIHQLFVGRLHAHEGKIALLRESINLVELGRAIYENGLADLHLEEDRAAIRRNQL